MNDLLLPLPSSAGEHPAACLVTVDLVGSTLLAQRLPLEVYASLMAEFVQVLILSAEALGGRVLQHQGDAVLALWPGERTQSGIWAALESHERTGRLGLASALGVQLQVRAGVALGPVVVGMVGGQLSAYGLPVNYSRRLCDAAHAGETLVCEGVVGQHVDGALLAARPLPHLRGFGPECRAYTVHMISRQSQSPRSA
ncbi:adenylate/guanylate cyclase domain-containing protein [Deinococcus hopiensis]|nr:adenylate/guanylate cyclase domain-containing protein [Deinococcus hopiensis]